jgi:tetratricopeptide (TPR) repeat protein
MESRMTSRFISLVLAATLAVAVPASSLAPHTAQAQAALDFKQIDDQWDNHRHEPAVLKPMLAQLEQAAKQGDRYDIDWRIARIYWWEADGQSDNAQMEALAKKGWDWAEKAVKANPNAIEGNFWLAANIGQYSLAVGVLRALANGLESKFTDPLDKSIKLNPLYADAGPLRTKGSYYQNLPWPKRDLKKAIQLLSEAAARSPRGIRSRWYLAQAYEKDGNIKAAIGELDKILAADPRVVDPSDITRLKPWAQKMKARLQAGG